MTKRSKRARTIVLIGLAIFLLLLLGCLLLVLLLSREGSPRETRGITLQIAYSPEKAALMEQLVDSFNDRRARLPDGEPVRVELTAMEPATMVEQASIQRFHAVCPDSSIWLGEIDRRWRQERADELGLVGETTRFAVSPVVIAMWPDVAQSLGYPDKELGWRDILRAAVQDKSFKWSHPSTNTASGLLATLAQFYVGAERTRDLTKEIVTSEAILNYVGQLEKTVKHYGEGEAAVISRVAELGREYLDAFVVQEQMVVQFNRQRRDKGEQLLAIYPVEGTLWEDHPLALLEHPWRNERERLAYRLFREYLLSPETQMMVLRYGYRPTDLDISLDHPESPITPENGADPTKPYTTLQIPSPTVISVVRDVWWFTKRHTNVYLVVDVSGSMQGRKLADVQEALHLFVAQIEGDLERVGLITFASSAREIVPLTQLGEGRSGLTRAIDSLSAQGNTALLDAVDLAVTKLVDLNDHERINAIVVMTDGRENRSRTNLSEVAYRLRLTVQSDLPVVVFCIAYGRDADMDVLRALSDASGGFTSVGNEETIRSLYKTLSTYF